jgi:hypothetical protein
MSAVVKAGLLLGTVLPCAAGQRPAAEQPHGREDHIWFGYAIAPIGDWDGDAAGDFLVGAPRESIHWGDDRVEPRASIRALSGARGKVLFVCSAGAGFGSSIAVLGDLDGDGKLEFASGSTTGSAWVCSGADGSVVRTLEGPFPELARPTARGAFVASPGDLDGDGFGDLVISWHAWIDGPLGKLRVHSGRTGDQLYAIEGVEGPMVQRVFALSDLNGDGVTEWGFTSPLAGYSDPAIAKVVSGRDGSDLYSLVPQRPTASAGLTLASIGDLTGDGVSELALGACELSGTEVLDPGQKPRDPAGEVQVFSGRSGSRLSLHSEEVASATYGRAIAGGADLDADGVPDYAVTEHEDRWRNVERGRICLYSGKDHSLIREVYGKSWEDFGVSVALLGDVDRDGLSDIAVGCMHDYVGSYDPGRVLVVSGKSGKKLYYVPP